jgi:hypothetical protein
MIPGGDATVLAERVAASTWEARVDIRPAMSMTIEELMSIAEYIRAGDFTLSEFLREKLARTVNIRCL